MQENKAGKTTKTEMPSKKVSACFSQAGKNKLCTCGGKKGKRTKQGKQQKHKCQAKNLSLFSQVGKTNFAHAEERRGKILMLVASGKWGKQQKHKCQAKKSQHDFPRREKQTLRMQRKEGEKYSC